MTDDTIRDKESLSYLITDEIPSVLKHMKKNNGGVDRKVELKIVGSISDKGQIDILKSITEIFIIERRIHDLFEHEQKDVYLLS